MINAFLTIWQSMSGYFWPKLTKKKSNIWMDFWTSTFPSFIGKSSSILPLITQLESFYSLVVMITFVLLFCCVLVGPARRRKRFTQVIGVTENQSPNQSYINQAFENYDDTFISEHNTDGIILKALPDYGELKVNLHY